MNQVKICMHTSLSDAGKLCKIHLNSFLYYVKMDHFNFFHIFLQQKHHFQREKTEKIDGKNEHSSIKS